VMAFSVISISSDSSEESVGTSTARVILFGTIPTTIPSTTRAADVPVIHDDTSLIPTDTLTISPIVPTILPIAPTIQSRVAARSSPPSSPIRQILPAPPGLPRRPIVLVLPGQPIPVGRPYRTHPNGVLQMLTVRKSVGSLPTYRISSRYPSDSSSSDHFTSDDLLRDSRYALSDSPCDSPTVTSAGPSRKRCRSHTSSVTVVSPIRRALLPVHADLLPPHKRIRDSEYVMDFEVSSEDGCETRDSGRFVLVFVEAAKHQLCFSLSRKKPRWGTVFPTGLKRYKEPFVEPKEIG
ncbi:hypothetical protein Tco_1230805, partial [Tanacetum coccineum]